jgi:WD40-like Beta Propeller Repeat
VDHDGRRRVLVRFSGGLLFAASPDGERIAYRLDRPGGRSAGVFVAGVEGGAPTRVTRGAATAFFWSPTGDRLLMLTPEGAGDVPLHRWRVWAGRERFVGDPFLPSPTFLRAYLPFFDQYARSLTPWSPDGSAFAYAGLHEGRAGIWVQGLDGARERRFVAPGEVVGWAPAPA